MTLALSSVLHYWTARYGSVPVVGGKPVHARSSAGTWIDQQGILQSAVVNTPRFNWGTIDSERRQVMTLEQARTNSLLQSSDLSHAAWTKLNLTVGTGKPDPAGGTSAFSLTATASNGEIAQSAAASSSIRRTNSIWLRRRTGSGPINLQDQDGNNGYAPAVTDSWQRFFVTTAAASGNRTLGVRVATSGDSVDAYLPQQDDAAVVSSAISTGSAAVTRAADSFYWDFVSLPQGLMAYIRFVEKGTALMTGAGSLFLFSIGDGSGRAFAYNDGGGGYRLNYNNGSAGQESGALTPAYDEVVELVAVLTPAGAIELIMSRNGAAVTSAAPGGSAALPAAWGSQKLWLNSITNAPGISDFAEVKIVKHADVVAVTNQGIMEELRAFELGPNGAVL